jgi:hypothetical protein
MMLNKLLTPNTFALFVIGCLAISCSEEEQGITYSPAITAPEFEASNQSLEVTLQWEDTDVAYASETYQFDVYLGTSKNNLQLLASGVNHEEFRCSTLALNTTYFWKVVVKAYSRGANDRLDNRGSKESAVSTFVTTQELPRIEIGNKTIMFFPGDYLGDLSLTGYWRWPKVAGAFNWDDGEQNTRAILNYYGENVSLGWGAAADYCDKLEAYGYNDWYLPSIREIDAVATENNLLRNDNDIYWSSTELNLNPQVQPQDAVFTKSTRRYPDMEYSVAQKTAFHIKCRCVRQD